MVTKTTRCEIAKQINKQISNKIIREMKTNKTKQAAKKILLLRSFSRICIWKTFFSKGILHELTFLS